MWCAPFFCKPHQQKFRPFPPQHPPPSQQKGKVRYLSVLSVRLAASWSNELISLMGAYRPRPFWPNLLECLSIRASSNMCRKYAMGTLRRVRSYKVIEVEIRHPPGPQPITTGIHLEFRDSIEKFHRGHGHGNTHLSTSLRLTTALWGHTLDQYHTGSQVEIY